MSEKKSNMLNPKVPFLHVPIEIWLAKNQNFVLTVVTPLKLGGTTKGIKAPKMEFEQQ